METIKRQTKAVYGVWLQVKVRGCGLSLRHIGCTSALYVTQKRCCSCSCSLWRYMCYMTWLTTLQAQCYGIIVRAGLRWFRRGEVFGFLFSVKLCTKLYVYIFIYKLIYKAPHSRNFRGAISSQRWPKPYPVLVAPTHGGMARLSGLDKYRDGRPARGRHQSQY